MSKRKGIMLAYPFEKKRLLTWSSPIICQPKYDGERCHITWVNNKSVLVSSEENAINSVPHINEHLDRLPKEFHLEFDGELYHHGMPFEEISSIVSRTVNLHPDYHRMDYYIFDHISPKRQCERLFDLIKAPLRPPLVYSPWDFARSFEAVYTQFELYCSRGFEGIIVREFNMPYVTKRSTGMMKFKPKKKDCYKIVGYNEEVSIKGVPKGTLGSFICEKDGQRFSVGSGLTQEQRREYWQIREGLVGMYCVVAYQHITTKEKVPRFPVFIGTAAKPIECDNTTDFRHWR